MTTTTLCSNCRQGPTGELGHGTLAHHVEGPYPGHHIFRCEACDERWIRHYGSAEVRYAWSRYALQFPLRRPMPSRPPVEEAPALSR